MSHLSKYDCETTQCVKLKVLPVLHRLHFTKQESEVPLASLQYPKCYRWLRLKTHDIACLLCVL